MYSNMFEGLLGVIIKFIIVVSIAFGTIVYFVAKAMYKTNKIESKTLIRPEIRLTTDGKKVDTIYVYKTK